MESSCIFIKYQKISKSHELDDCRPSGSNNRKCQNINFIGHNNKQLHVINLVKDDPLTLDSVVSKANQSV